MDFLGSLRVVWIYGECEKLADTKGRFKYTEPAEYFPNSIMKKYKIGKYAETKTETEKEKSETDKK